ncbi:hypothetical protein D3C78_893730 [compost metagenome]
MHHLIENAAQTAGAVAGMGALLQALTPTLLNALFGIAAGGVVLGAVSLFGALRSRLKQA